MRLPKTIFGRVFLSLFLVVLVAELAVLSAGIVRWSAELNELERTNRSLKRLCYRDPYPSALNVTTAGNNLEELDCLVSEFGAGLKGDPFPANAIEPAGFSARAQDVIERFQLKAKLAGIALPSANEAGFADYASGGAVPRSEDVPRLSRQLYSVERVAGTLVGSGVKSIDRLTRELFEKKAADLSGRRGRSSGGNAEGVANAGSDLHPSGICYVEKIGVTFTADEKTVWLVLDSFSQAPHFMVVTDFSHISNSDILQFNPADHASEQELAYLSGGVLTGAQAISRDERVIAGDELIRVDLVVEVYNFELMEGM